MSQWPHSPARRVSPAGHFIVTAGTYRKEHWFGTRDRLDLLQDELLRATRCHRWDLDAWSVFSNHYHFVGSTEEPASLSSLIREIHSRTARKVNAMDAAPGRTVWFQYWDTSLTFQKSYLARLRYVHENPVHHGLVRNATLYPWCSAAWFVRVGSRSFVRTVKSFPPINLSSLDDFSPMEPSDDVPVAEGSMERPTGSQRSEGGSKLPR